MGSKKYVLVVLKKDKKKPLMIMKQKEKINSSVQKRVRGLEM